MQDFKWRKESLAESTKWFRNNLRKLKSGVDKRKRNQFTSGDIYIYRYDPKLKLVLPYYDTIPVVLVLKLNPDGFLGLNFHYLPPQIRQIFIKKLKAFKFNENAFGLDYVKLRDYPIFSEYKPCIKQYLYSHVTSNIKYIPVEEWEFVTSLSIEHFIKMNKEEVWKESMDKIED